MEEKIIQRAANLLNYMSEMDAQQKLVESGITPDMAFLYVKAGSILLKDKNVK